MSFSAFKGLVAKYLKISVRDKPMWFWVFGYPLLFMMIFSVGLRDVDTVDFSVAFINYDSEIWADQIQGNEIDFASIYMIALFSPNNEDSSLADSFTIRVDLSESEAKELVDSNLLDAVVILPENFTEIIMNNSLTGAPEVRIYSTPDPTKEALIQSVIGNIVNQLIQNQNNVDVAKIVIEKGRPDIKAFDYIMPGVVIAGVTIAIMNIAQNMGNEKEKGLLQRLDTTPVPRSLQLAAGGTAQLIFTSIQLSILLACLPIFGVDIHPNANWFLAFLNGILLGFTCIGLGLIVAAIVKDANAAGGMAWIIILPLQFFGGSLALLEVKGFPTYYAVQGMRNILVSGLGFASVSNILLINFIYGIIFMAAGMIIFSKKSQV